MELTVGQHILWQQVPKVNYTLRKEVLHVVCQESHTVFLALGIIISLARCVWLVYYNVVVVFSILYSTFSNPRCKTYYKAGCREESCHKDE